MGSLGLLISMAVHYVFTTAVSWFLHAVGEINPWTKMRTSLVAMALGGTILFSAYVLSSPILVYCASALFGCYEALFWCSFHKEREIEHGSTESGVAHWNAYEKIVSFSLLLLASIFSEFKLDEICILLGICVALYGSLTIRPSFNSAPQTTSRRNHSRPQLNQIPLILPFLEGITATCWVFYLRLVTLDDSFIDIPLIGTGAPALARVIAVALLLGAGMHYLISKYELKITISTVIILQTPILLLLILDFTPFIQLTCVVVMSLLRSIMYGQAVHTFRSLLYSTNQAHDTRERLKFTGRTFGISIMFPLLFAPVSSILVVYGITLLLLYYLIPQIPLEAPLDSRTA